MIRWCVHFMHKTMLYLAFVPCSTRMPPYLAILHIVLSVHEHNSSTSTAYCYPLQRHFVFMDDNKLCAN